MAFLASRRTPASDPLLSREEGVRAAYAAHGDELYRLAMRGLGDAGAAQDVVQETFLRAWRARERYDATRASLRTWLFEIARNVVIDAQRARTARPWLRGLADHETLEQAAPGVGDGWDALMRRVLVEEALRRLGEDHRRAIEETYLADRPYPEVAAELGIPESTLRSRVFYGLKALRVVMEEMEVTP
ncbi:sigma-70 family RNA polymerase sigma factor [Nocardioides sp.]|uniref:sigma-70 family RNA polymerase sigma factor n=1 Tax=Nocardioides sp. TaxID=35761 RepID=UPI002718ABBF|nr:sigma-70 family RNA polymerase sigma factor [Nocardioides sp.]MDO9457645.1 sigma-70 family RNA polymerase sigma factor [Nocardioides sp.]